MGGTLSAQAIRHIGFPWSQALVLRTLGIRWRDPLRNRGSARNGWGGTLPAARIMHFEAKDRAFGVFNDIAVAIQWSRAADASSEQAVIDLDVHQGDGTARIFETIPPCLQRPCTAR